MIPKFRAFIKFKGAVNPMQRVSKINFGNETITIEQGLVFKLDDTILMQSTGLTDLNGNEIFADDIVKMQFRVYEEPELFVVKTKAGHAARVDYRTKGTELWLRHNHCEVVGNRWENPELMEVGR